jgi:hypothetical protein
MGQELEALQGVLGVLIPLTAIVLGIGIGFWSLYLEHQRKMRQFQERQLMIEKGMTPAPMLPEESKRLTPQDALRRGFVMVFLGMGMGLAAVVATSYEQGVAWLLATGASITGFLGVGYLVFYVVSRRLAARGD